MKYAGDTYMKNDAKSELELVSRTERQQHVKRFLFVCSKIDKDSNNPLI